MSAAGSQELFWRAPWWILFPGLLRSAGFTGGGSHATECDSTFETSISGVNALADSEDRFRRWLDLS